MIDMLFSEEGEIEDAEKMCLDRATVVREWAVLGGAALLARHLVAVLESVERLPVLAYDAPPAAPGLQILTRRLRLVNTC